MNTSDLSERTSDPTNACNQNLQRKWFVACLLLTEVAVDWPFDQLVIIIDSDYQPPQTTR